MNVSRHEDTPVGVAVAGLGGFAGSIANLLLDQASSPAGAGEDTSGGKSGGTCGPGCRLIAVGDPAAEHPEMAKRREALAAAGAAVYTSFDRAMQDPGVEAVWLPVPIHLHRKFAESAFAAGKHVMCEKPLAGSLEDIDAMIRARDAAGRLGLVGFHDLYQPQTLQIKRQLRNGAIGELRGATVFCSWPRDTLYFGRSGWAGCRYFDGTAVMDSPANNAMAHYLMLALFLLGARDRDAASPLATEARTFRAAPIENYDTVSARLTLPDNATLSLQLTHASRHLLPPQVFLHGSKQTWCWTVDTRIQPIMPVDRVFVAPADTRAHMVRRLAQAVRGEPGPDQPLATFEAARAHAMAIAQIDQAGPVQGFPTELIQPVPSPNSEGMLHHVPGLVEAMQQAARDGELIDLDRITHAAPSETDYR